MVDVVSLLEFVVGLLSLAILALLVLWLRTQSLSYSEEDLESEVKRRLQQQLYAVKGAIGEALAPHMKEFLERYEPLTRVSSGVSPWIT